MHNNIIILIYIFFVGATLGSFIGLVVDRLPHQLKWVEDPRDNWNIIFPRSECNNCAKKIIWHALIPILGYLINRGKCKNCKMKVPVVYPIFELFCGFVVMMVIYYFGFSTKGILTVILFLTLLLLSWIDINQHWLPAVITVPLFWLGLLMSPYCVSAIDRIQGAAIGFFLPIIVMLFISYMKKQDVMAGGDVALMSVAGAWLGGDKMLTYILMSNLFFIIYALPSRIKGYVFVPMGPALSLGLVYCLL